MGSARPHDAVRSYRLPCGESLTSLLASPDESRSGSRSDRGGECIRPVNVFNAAEAAPTLGDADGVMGTLPFALPTAAPFAWALNQYFCLLEGWFGATNRLSSLDPCLVSARGDLHEHPGERRR